MERAPEDEVRERAPEDKVGKRAPEGEVGERSPEDEPEVDQEDVEEEEAEGLTVANMVNPVGLVPQVVDLIVILVMMMMKLISAALKVRTMYHQPLIFLAVCQVLPMKLLVLWISWSVFTCFCQKIFMRFCCNKPICMQSKCEEVNTLIILGYLCHLKN